MVGLKKIIIVEDDAMIRELYKSTLFNSNLYEVEVAGKATEFYEKLEVFQPDLIMLDIMLPETSGLEILSELRKNPKYNSQNSKIIMLTNLAERSVIDKAIESGADGYVIKSDILPKDLLKIIPTVIN